MQSTTEYTTKGSTIQSTAYHGSNASTTYYCRTTETAQSAASIEVSISCDPSPQHDPVTQARNTAVKPTPTSQ